MYRQICGLRRQGTGRAEIAVAFGCSVSTVDRAIRLCGEKEVRRDSFEEHQETTMQMYDDGATQAEIAAATGMSVSVIGRRRGRWENGAEGAGTRRGARGNQWDTGSRKKHSPWQGSMRRQRCGG